MPQSNNGKIAVRPHQGTIKTSQLDKLMGYGSTFQHSEASRSTEDDALAGLGPIQVLDELQREIALLERIGRDPRNYGLDYPVRDRPHRPIFGDALWAWIGRQPGITLRAREVRKHLEVISQIEERRAEAGLDRDTIGTE